MSPLLRHPSLCVVRFDQRWRLARAAGRRPQIARRVFYRRGTFRNRIRRALLPVVFSPLTYPPHVSRGGARCGELGRRVLLGGDEVVVRFAKNAAHGTDTKNSTRTRDARQSLAATAGAPRTPPSAVAQSTRECHQPPPHAPRGRRMQHPLPGASEGHTLNKRQ
jgi:hypothetical protein